ncbi:MAG: hypothetical protein AAFU55_09880 [Pseudomonadota bacterium]
MPRENPHRPFTPHPDLMAIAPDISGNEINGLGETAKRPPEVVYWSPDTSAIPHGRMQEWFYTRDPDDPHIARARAERIETLSAEVPEVEGEPVRRSEDEWAQVLAAYAETADFEMIGVTEMRPDYLMAGRETDFTRVIMIGVAHDYAEISMAPETRAGAEVLKQYGRAGAAAKALAGWLRLQGWPADPVTGPFSSEITMIPPAIDAGLSPAPPLLRRQPFGRVDL